MDFKIAGCVILYNPDADVVTNIAKNFDKYVINSIERESDFAVLTQCC